MPNRRNCLGLADASLLAPASRLVARAHRDHFAATPFDAWCDELIGELRLAGALRVRDGIVENA